MTKTCAFAALTLAALAGTAFANPADEPATATQFRVVRGLQPAEYPPARSLPEVIQPTFDNITDSFVNAGAHQIVVLGSVNIMDDINFNPGPWGSAYAGPRLANSMKGFGFQFSGTTVPIDCDIVFDFYNDASIDYTRVYTPGALPTDPPVSPGILADNTNSLARFTVQIRALTPGFIYTFENLNLTGLPGGGVSFAGDKGGVRVRAVRAGTDPLMTSSFMFAVPGATPPGGVNPSSNPVGQTQTAQIVFPMFQLNYLTGSTSVSYGRDANVDGFFAGNPTPQNANPFERRQILASTGAARGMAIGLTGDAPPPPAPTPATDLGTLNCATSSPANQTASITVATAGDPNAIPPVPAAPGSISWFKITLPGPVSVADGTFLNILASDVNGFGIDPSMGLYNVVGALQKSDNNSGGGFTGTDSLLTFGIGRQAPVNGSKDLDGRSGDLALVAGSGGGDFYLGVAAGGAGFGAGFNVNRNDATGGSNGDVTVSFSHNLSAAGNCALPDAVAPTITGANAVGLLPHGTVTTVTVTAGSEDITWLSFENDVAIGDADTSKFLDIDVLGSSVVADTELGVYDSAGNNVTIDDDSGPGAFSQISFQGAGGPARPASGDGLPYNGQDGPLAVGTYYLAVGLFDVVFQATRWGARSDSGSNLNVAVNFRTSSDCVADFNVDGVVNPDDLADFIGGFFSVPPNPACDFNNDGNVDPDDLADFIGAFFSSPASCAG